MPPPSVLQCSVTVPASVDTVFRFHLDTRNAPLISPGNARFLAIDGTFPVRAGSVVTLRVRQWPLPFGQTWRVRIAEVRDGALVTDVAERSPFAAWRHEHRFRPVDGGHTLMTDQVTYRLPFGWLGWLVDRLVVRRLLRAMFAERHRRTVAHFSGVGSWRGPRHPEPGAPAQDGAAPGEGLTGPATRT